MSDRVQIHDHFFKEFLSRPEAAIDLMRHYLPADVVELLDVSAPELVKDSFVDDTLRQHLSDLLYKVQLKDGQGAYVYILFEHKSAPDHWIAFQLLRYIVRIWEQSLQQHQVLYPIVPLVMYHGAQRWQVPPSLHAIVAAPEAFKRFTPEYEYWLCDLSRYTDEQIKGEAMLQLFMLLLKHAFSSNWDERLPIIIELMHELAQYQTGLGVIQAAMMYMSQGVEHIGEKELRRVIEAVYPREGGVMMATLAEKWLQQGREEGRQEGQLEGEQRGIRQGLLMGIELGLELKFGREGLGLLPEVRGIEDVDVLRKIQEKIKTSATPNELRGVYAS